MRKISLLIIFCSLVFLTVTAQSANKNSSLIVNEPVVGGYVILGRPTESEITARIIAPNPADVWIEYGATPGNYSQKTNTFAASRERPANIVISGLKKGQKYYYQVHYERLNSKDVIASPECSFTTARPTGETFTFAVQSDSHLLNKADKVVYQKVMDNIAALQPDFFLDLGDAFLNDQQSFDKSALDINDTYYQQVPYMSKVAQSAPLFLVIGNHEGEYGYLLNGTANNMPVYAALSRKQYYPNPEPNDFYTGNSTSEEFIGLAENYYAYTWGDALFVALDPYRYTVKDPAQTKDNWDWTLGEKQYQWFKQTLEQSRAKYKFVFAHHAISNIRGGAKVAGLYEWGGLDNKNKSWFDQKRPGWGQPIQQLMKEHGVTIFFQGHDHLFAREEVDGVIYQTLPKPAEVIPDQQNNFSDYPGADLQINSGFLRVKVQPQYVQVDYVRSVVAGQPDNPNTGVVYSYTVDAAGKVNVLKETDDSSVFAAYTQGAGNPDKEKKNSGEKQPGKNPGAQPNLSEKGPAGVFFTEVPARDFDIILGRPTQNSITASILSYQDLEGYLEHGVKVGDLKVKTKSLKFIKDEPLEIKFEKLQPNTRYFYRFCYRKPDAKDFTQSKVYNFQTQRPAGNTFVYTVQADPHLDENTNTDFYQQTLAKVLAGTPDFHIDLGDTFMTNKYRDFKDSFQQYLAQRYYFGLVCHSAPLFLTLGNHDGEGWIKKNSPNQMTIWATNIRNRYFPNPFPDGFFTGNETKEDLTGWPENYYAWEWGDALFIALDPYRYTPADNPWERTLGEKQYRWLQQTLANSKAKYKFIFIHNLVGGADLNGKARGGAEAAKYYEWGGLNADGSPGFEQHRPGWEKPIHDLLVQYHVSIVFHGHDHFFAKQELDGVIYQMVPQPGNPRAGLGQVKEYGYQQGEFLPGSGHLRVTVSQAEVKVEFLRTATDSVNGAKETGGVEYTYTLK